MDQMVSLPGLWEGPWVCWRGLVRSVAETEALLVLGMKDDERKPTGTEEMETSATWVGKKVRSPLSRALANADFTSSGSRGGAFIGDIARAVVDVM